MVRHDLMHALWKKLPDLAAHIENVIMHQDNALCRTTRNTLLKSVRVPASYSSTIFNGPGTIGLRIVS